MSEKKYHHHDELIHVEYTLDGQFHHYAVANVLIHPGITPKMANEYAGIFVNALNAPNTDALKAENEKLKSTLIGMCSDSDDPDIKQFDKDVIARKKAITDAIDALVSAVREMKSEWESDDSYGSAYILTAPHIYNQVLKALAAYLAKAKGE